MLVQSARVGMGRFREGVRVRDFPLLQIESVQGGALSPVSPSHRYVATRVGMGRFREGVRVRDFPLLQIESVQGGALSPVSPSHRYVATCLAGFQHINYIKINSDR